MAQTKHDIQALLAEAGQHPRQRFGQNFMIDGNLVRLVADAGQIKPGDLVIEVGPGTGSLTEELLVRSTDLLAVEIDRHLAHLLRSRFPAANFRLLEGDALAGKHALNPQLLEIIRQAKQEARTIRLVANLPYNVASPLAIEFLIAGVDHLAFTVQKEVADRLRAAPGSKDYGPLSVMAQLLSKVELLRTLPPQAFWPMPKIESALVRLTRDDRLGPQAGAFGAFVHQLFSSRRKTLRNALLHAGFNADKAMLAAALDPTIRAEQIGPDGLRALFLAAQIVGK
jgi:16S rRNA (adenine1518-N6/adenine1519-N6)-dimethyltransferase